MNIDEEICYKQRGAGEELNKLDTQTEKLIKTELEKENKTEEQEQTSNTKKIEMNKQTEDLYTIYHDSIAVDKLCEGGLEDNMFDGQYENLAKKKKNINFKVIKNKDQLPTSANFFSNPTHKGVINNCENNNKNNFNFYHEVPFADSLRSHTTEKALNMFNKDFSINSIGYAMNPYRNTHVYNNIRKHSYDNQMKRIDKKLKNKDRHIYIDILINAAEKFISDGYTLTEQTETRIARVIDADSNTNDAVISVNTNIVENNISKEQTNSSLEHSVSVKSALDVDINSEGVLNYEYQHTNDEKRTKRTNSCENKTCPSFGSKRKLNVVKKKITKGKFLWLCQTCSKSWNSGQYCYYCFYIYRDSNINSCADGKDWVQCDYCFSWQHIHCEERKGAYPTLHKQLDDENFKYQCPSCREKGKGVHPGNSGNTLLKKKRNTQKTNINCYRKEYDISFKYSNSKRIREKIKMIEKTSKEMEKFKDQTELEKKTKKKVNANPIELSETKVRKKTLSNGNVNNLSFLNEFETSREIIHDIYKIQDKMNPK